MTGPNPSAAHLQQLKERALALAQQQPGDTVTDLATVEVTKLLEDLRIYQIELELQNEELRSAQHGLAVSRRRYQSLFEQMPLPALVVEARGLIEECNERAATLLGERKAHGSLDNRLFQGLSRDDRTRLHVALRDVRDGEPLVLHKLAIAVGPEPALMFDAHLIQLSMDYHLDIRVLVLLVDRSAEVAREKDQRFFSLLLDSSENLIAAADGKGHMLLANQTLLKLLGRTPEAVLGKRRESFLPLRDAILQTEADQRVMLTGEPVTVEEQFHVGGAQGTLDFLTRKFPLLDEQGQIYGVGGISTDITEIKDKQRQTLLSESVFMTAAEAIIVTDPHTRIIRVNPA
ncbi:MAG: PAS domain-containing protein, partial [Rhodoferax sp.]|nr:PAS domain-containing protein [Rhodoferax sp.]